MVTQDRSDVPLLGRFAVGAGLVTRRQTFVRRCQSRTVGKGLPGQQLGRGGPFSFLPPPRAYSVSSTELIPPAAASTNGTASGAAVSRNGMSARSVDGSP